MAASMSLQTMQHAATAAGTSSAVGLSVKSLLFSMVFGAGACFTTPLGYQTNMMVMKDGGYTFGDFLKFGIPIQLFHMSATVFFQWFFFDILATDSATAA